jgi:hypothetical protein
MRQELQGDDAFETEDSAPNGAPPITKPFIEISSKLTRRVPGACLSDQRPLRRCPNKSLKNLLSTITEQDRSYFQWFRNLDQPNLSKWIGSSVLDILGYS